MCSSIGQCGGVSGSNLEFGFFSSLAIDLFVQDATCLPETNRLELPFEDMVLSTAIDSQKWAHWNFAEGIQAFDSLMAAQQIFLTVVSF